MIKILSDSNKIECRCGCVFEFDKSDVEKKKHFYNAGLFFTHYESYEYLYVKCPICSRELLI